ncbi:MAG: InlB B-repeat-containing protein [Erysipelotrichaceae bacterium]|nr:InlB B-repeat-containing protein [Erysipelotrichaceae bacterium]
MNKYLRLNKRIKTWYSNIARIFIILLMLFSSIPVSHVDALQIDSDNENSNFVYELKRNINSADGDEYEIKTEFNEESDIENDYQLSVSEINSDFSDYEDYRRRSAELLGNDDVALKIYNLSIVSENEKIIPETEISFVIEKVKEESSEEYENTEILLLYGNDQSISDDTFTVDFSESEDKVILVLANIIRNDEDVEEPAAQDEEVEVPEYAVSAVFSRQDEHFYNELIDIDEIEKNDDQYEDYINENNMIVDNSFINYHLLFDLQLNQEEYNFSTDKDDDVTIKVRLKLYENYEKLDIDQLAIVCFENGRTSLIIPNVVENDDNLEISFEVEDELVFALAEAKQNNVLTYRDHDYLITASYNSLSGIPVDAQLRVMEITEDDDSYDDYINISSQSIGEEPENIVTARVFDIALIDPETGEECQPDGNVKISIELLRDTFEEHANVEVVHIQDIDKEETEVLDSTVTGETVEFETSGFSVYVICEKTTEGENYVTYFCDYVFYYLNEDNDYTEYLFKDENNETYSVQKIKNGDKPLVPQITSSEDMVFSGWYEGSTGDGGAVEISETPYDFDNIPEIIENSSVLLFARYKKFANVVFYGQYDNDNSKWPIAFSRRSELDEENNGKIKISDLKAKYNSDSGKTMVFYGWSYKPVSVPGSSTDDEGNEVSIITPDEDGYIDITESIELYPVYKDVHLLTYYAGYSGSGADYVPPAYYYSDTNVADPLPIVSRKGYSFEGWYTGTLNTDGDKETITYGAQVTDGNGNLVSSIEDDTFYIMNEELYMRSDATLYAKWGADYKVVIWKQKTSDEYGVSEKHYDYVQSFTSSGEIGDEVTVSDTYKSLTISGYTYDHCDDSVTLSNYETAVLNVYYVLSGSYTPSGEGHSLKFENSNDDSTVMPDTVSNIEYGTSLRSYIPNDPVSATKSEKGKDVYSFGGWYFDKDCTINADLSEMAMPDEDLTVYAGWNPIKFRVKINPNYGALYYYDSGVLKGTGATWFNNTYFDNPIGEYTHVTRDYVESNSGNWYYVKHDLDYYGGVSGDDRKTYYTQNLNEATEDTTFERQPGIYSYVGWYEVDENGTVSESPYDFTQRTDHNTSLILKWKKNGVFYIAYNAGAGTLDDENSSSELIINNAYEDSASITLTVSANAPAGYTFTGWKVRGSDSNVIYAPGQIFTLNAEYAFARSGRDIVYLDAVYSRIGRASIIYDANGGIIAENADFGYKEDGSPATATISENKATVASIKNNSRFTLSNGVGFTNTGKEFLGWSTSATYDPNDDNAVFYPKAVEGSDKEYIYGVDTKEPTTLYAVWGVTVTYSLNSSNAQWPSDEYWNSYAYDEETNTYSKTVYLNNTISEPTANPTYTGEGDKLFRYWTADTTSNTKYDFSSAVTDDLSLYAYWSDPVKINVNVVDASSEALSLTDWEKHDVNVGTSEIELDPDDYVTKETDYVFAFMTVSSSLSAVSDDKTVVSLKYDISSRKICAKYSGSDNYVALNDTDELYFVYYKKKVLNVVYQKMNTAGTSTVPVSDSAKDSTEKLGSLAINEYLTSPLQWANDQSLHYYAYAIGDSNGGMNVITNVSDSDNARPALSIRNSWKGFEYSTDNSNWNSCGYEPKIYVIYFEQLPNIITINETTFATEGVIGAKQFSYTVVISSDDETSGEAQRLNFKLKSGESRRIIAYYENVSGVQHSQTVRVSQDSEDGFDTDNRSSVGTYESKYIWAYTTADPTTESYVEPVVSYSNSLDSVAVKVNIALIDQTGIKLANSLIGSGTDTFNISLGSSEKILTKLNYSDIYDGSSVRAFGAVAYGTDDNIEGNAVTVESYDAYTISYTSGENNVYHLTINDSNGNTIGDLDNNELYYVYYPLLKIKYVKYENGTLETIKGSVDGVSETDGLTYNRESVVLNDLDVEQNQPLSIDMKDFLISQTGGNKGFRMPPILDDGIYESYLGYDQIGIGETNTITSVSSLLGVSDDLSMHLRISEGVLQYSFDNESWNNVSWTYSPTIYAIYSERGYDLQVCKTVDTSSSGDNPFFTDRSFTVTISSDSITKSSYVIEGGDDSEVPAVPYDGTNPGQIVMSVRDGSKIKIKELGVGDYTITETEKGYFNLSAKTSKITGGSSTIVPVLDDCTVLISLDSDIKLDLINSPKALCRIIDNGSTHIFYTLNSAIDYVSEEIVNKTAMIEMLTDYVVPVEDLPIIPNGCDITITTADPGFSGAGTMAVFTRSESMLEKPLFTNNGTLCFENVIIDGASTLVSYPLIQSSGDLSIGRGTEISNAKNSGNGGIINATGGNISFENCTLSNNTADKGAVLYYSGNGSIDVKGTASIKENNAVNGGAIYAVNGTVDISMFASLNDNSASSNGGAVYIENGAVNISGKGKLVDNTATNGAAIYTEIGQIVVSGSESVHPEIKNNIVTENGGAIWIGSGSVEFNAGEISGNKAEDGQGGVVYSNSASVSVSSIVNISENLALNGAAIYSNSGNVTVSGGTVKMNTATENGGAIYTNSGLVTISDGDVINNKAESGSGGAIYSASGNVVLTENANVSSNTANTNGGAIYSSEGNVSLSCETLNSNKATNGKGGAIYAGSGALTVTSVSISSNRAGSDGGAIYSDSGSVTVSESILISNVSSGGNGGALCTGSGSINLSNTNFGEENKGNTASKNGGAIYSESGHVTLTDLVIMKYNTAGEKGGSLYVGSGSVSIPNTTTVSNNTAVNGAAVFVNSGRGTFSGGTYTNNTASSGGAIGMGSTDARLYFSGDIKISGNTLSDGETKSNIYLDQDSKDVLNMESLGSNADIGIYVPDSLTSERDVPGARFATYTENDVATTKITNDRRDFGVQKDTDSKQLFWGVLIKVEVRYQASFSDGLPPTADYTTKKAAFDYCPEFASAAISRLAEDVKNSNTLGLTSTAVYAIGFASGASAYSDYITNLIWDNDSQAWELKKRDGSTEALNNRTIIIYYAEPAYISVENNTNSALNISDLTVGNDTIGQLSVINTASNAGYGTVYAKNGSVRPSLLPATENDLKLAVNTAITLLLPGGQNMTYNLDGSFGSIASTDVRLRRGKSESLIETQLTVNSSGGFETLTGSTLNSNNTYKIIFGDDRYICKVVDSTGTEHRYTTISGAIADVVKTTSDDPPYSLETEKTAAIEMLVDYLLPSSDSVVVPSGYNITFTTASSGTYKYIPVDEGENRATISRDTDNTNAMISTTGGSTQTALTVKNLIFNVKGVQGSTEYGAIVAKGSSVTVDNVNFKDLFAGNGGAIFVETTSGTSNSWVKVTNSYFYNCHSTKTGDRDGGGAIHAWVDKLELENCEFDSCEGDWQAGGVFHKVESNTYYTESLVTKCKFTNCTSKAAGGMELGSRNIIVKECTFEHCNATSRNGGGFNVYALKSASPSADCWTTVENCIFNDCHLTGGNLNGGGFRSTSKYTTIVGTTFTNCSAVAYGGAVALSNSNAVKAELYGVSINGCSSATGGGVYFVGKQMVISDSYEVDSNGNPIFANGTAKAAGGANLSNGVAAGTHYVGKMSVENCTAKAVGGIYHDKDDNNATLKITNAMITGNVETESKTGGGGLNSKARNISITGSTISNNTSAGKGGGVNVSKANVLTLSNSTISNNTAASDGGGVYANKDNLVLSITGCTMNGNTSGDKGGAVYTIAKTITVTDSIINNCTAKNTGGGINQSQNSEGSSMTITGSRINNCKVTNASAGGVYSNAYTLSVSDSEISKNSATGSGGGILYDGNDTTRPLMSLIVSGCTFDGNTSNSNGGGTYTGVKSVIVESYTYPDGEAPISIPEVGDYITDNSGNITGRRTEISDCTAKSGGGIYHSSEISDSSFVLQESTITKCAATNGKGGGIYANIDNATVLNSEVSGNSASSDGGGIFKDKSGNNYYLIIDGSNIKTNTSGSKGGGIYCKSQLYMRNDSMISGNRLSSSTVNNAAGVYLEDNRTLYVGPEQTSPASAADVTDSSSINDNYTASGADSNLHLWYVNNQNAQASVYVYCNLSGTIGVTNAAKVGTQFGTSFIANPIGFQDDNAVFQADTSTLHGIIDRTDESGTKIIWAGLPIAKICGKDEDGNDILLYLKSVTLEDGTIKGSGPAIFDKLDTGTEGNPGSTTAAFNMLRTESPLLYKADGTLYTGKDYSVKMLDNYVTNADITVWYYEGRNVTFTTASSSDAEYPFVGGGSRATVVRGSGVNSNKTLFAAKGNLLLENIIIDGGSENGITSSSSTRCLWIGDSNNSNGAQVVTLGENAILQNAKVNGGDGGCVNLDKGSFVINGGTIRNCSTTKDGGGVFVNNGGTLTLSAGNIYQCSCPSGSGGGVRIKAGKFLMTGGTIRECSAVNGGGVYIAGNNNYYMNMSGGSIINNRATSVGGGIAFYNEDSRVYFSGRVNVSGNTVTKGGKTYTCNVELNKDSNSVINTNGGGLYPGAYIGVYVPNGTTLYNKHGQETNPFGTFADGDNKNNLYGFVNDRNGLKGGIITENPSPNTIYWIKIYSLRVSKTVEDRNSSSYDPNEEFTFVVTLRGKAKQAGQKDAKDIEGEYGEMTFVSNGTDSTTATFTLKDGESITGVNLSYGLYYEVEEKFTDDELKAKYCIVPGLRQTGEIGENKDETEIDPYTSLADYVNIIPVCKITDFNGNLLYRKYALNNKTYYIPAVYTELNGEKGAFAAINGVLYQNKTGTSYNPSQPYHIEMLVERYQLSDSLFVKNDRNILITTASKTASELPYRGSGSVGTIIRSQNGDQSYGSMLTVNGTLTLNNIILDNNKRASYTVNADGGLVSVRGRLNIESGASLQYSSVGSYLNEEGKTVGYRGGAVFVNTGGVVKMSGGEIRNNVSDGNGAGIYLSTGSTLYLSGNPGFGGTGVDVSGNINPNVGNFKNEAIVALNGGKYYSKPRQDIYLEESNENNPSSIVIDGDLTGENGSIWVWSDSEYHNKTLMPFGKISNSVTSACNFAMFRNAQDDTTSENKSDNEYLYGTNVGDNSRLLYWSGNYGFKQIILRKISDLYNSLSGACFNVYRGSSNDPYITSSGERLVNLYSDNNGVFWVGELPYGTYYIYELIAPENYENNQRRWYCLIIDDTGNYVAPESSETRDMAFARTIAIKGSS